MEIIVTESGETKIIGASDKLLDESQMRRASEVLPCNPVLRILFRALRLLGGEHGWLADFTRRWNCWWYVDLARSGGPIQGPFLSRERAIRWEIDWLRDRILSDQL